MLDAFWKCSILIVLVVGWWHIFTWLGRQVCRMIAPRPPPTASKPKPPAVHDHDVRVVFAWIVLDVDGVESILYVPVGPGPGGPILLPLVSKSEEFLTGFLPVIQSLAENSRITARLCRFSVRSVLEEVGSGEWGAGSEEGENKIPV